MKFYFTLTKRNLAVMVAAAIIILILLGQFFTANASGIDGSTNAKRVEYLSRLGLAFNETPTEIKDIKIPETFSDVYEKYNTLQIEAGFNLKNHRGDTAKVYTYALLDDSVVHLIICEDKVIGGDISSTKIDGTMKPLRKDE